MITRSRWCSVGHHLPSMRPVRPSRFMSATRTLCAMRAPTSRHTCATFRLSVTALEANTPGVANSARWSPLHVQTAPADASMRRHNQWYTQASHRHDAELRLWNHRGLRAFGHSLGPTHAGTLSGPAPRTRAQGDEYRDALRGWQRHAARVCHERACELHAAGLSLASHAVL